MSYWVLKKAKNGKRSLYAVDFPIQIILVIIGLLAAGGLRYLNPNKLVGDSTGIIFIGFLPILISKSSLFKKRTWFSWGSKFMSKPFRVLYVLGYILIGIGFSTIITIALAFRGKF
ncbi:MAG TPA: hypothetical protein DCP92_05085 [Nitrospiraceae bacterium]|nr:hypothetical protein [Nitrospiraceae bacterium]